jgi:plasmid maintenance system antidote protein VapI
MALRLELVFNKPSADHWLNLQNAYDLWQTRQSKADLHVQPYKIEMA